MSTRIPLPGNMIDTLMKGVNTGSSMYSGIMGPILDREKQAQAEKHFQEQLKLQKEAAGRAAQAAADAHRKMDPMYDINQYQALENWIKGQSGGQQNSQQGSQSGYPALNKMFSGQGAFNEGEMHPGNIDLGNRPNVPNPETGGTSTVYSMSIGTPQGEVLIPRVSDDGRILSEPDAIEQFHKTGKHLGIYSSPDEANRAAEAIHQQQAQSIAQKPSSNNMGGLDMDLLKSHPMLRGFAKKHLGFDPLAPVPQTPEDKNEAALNLFKQKEAIKVANKTGSGETLTAPIKTKYQNVIGGVTSARPILQKLIAETKKGNIPGQAIGALFKRDAQANYKGEISTLLDGVRNAYTIPNTDSGTAKAEDKVLRKSGESDANYAKRLESILNQMDARERDARTKLNAGNITASASGDDYSKMSDDELRKIAEGG